MPEVIIPGQAGRIEGRYHFSAPCAPIVLILHPDPKSGGTMNSKVVYTMYKSFTGMGFNVLRFNFRGAGNSEGESSKGEGELADAIYCWDWLRAKNPDPKQCWVAGFSFGAWIGMQLLMRRPEFHYFVSISPPANMYDFNFLAPCPSSGLVLHGAEDDVVDVQSVSKLVTKISAQKRICVNYETIENANHFFTDHLDNISSCVKSYVHKMCVT